MSFKIYKSIDGEWIMEIDGKPLPRYKTLASLAKSLMKYARGQSL